MAQVGLTPTPQGKGHHGPLFWTSKTTSKRIYMNQIPIDYDDENYEYNDDNCDNFYAYDDKHDQKPSVTMTLWSKYTPFAHYYLVKNIATGKTSPAITPFHFFGYFISILFL